MDGINSFLPLQLFGSGQLLCLPENCQTGLILQSPHYADFAGAGAAVGGEFDIKCTSIYVIGNANFLVPELFQERQRAFRQRLLYMNNLHKITYVRSPVQRAYLIVRQLSQWLGLEAAQNIPPNLVAALVGILPSTVEAGWQQYSQLHTEPPPVALIPQPVEADPTLSGNVRLLARNRSACTT